MHTMTAGFAAALPKYLCRTFLFVLAWQVVGCITINIYFPAAAAEKAADQVIDQIWQDPNTAPAAHAPISPPARSPQLNPLQTPTAPLPQELKP